MPVAKEKGNIYPAADAASKYREKAKKIFY